MPSKKDTAYLKRCRDRIDSAEAFRKKEGLDDLWQRCIDLYRGKHFPKGLTAQDLFVVNISFSTINVIGPSVSVNHPKITVNASQPEDDDRAVILEAVINYWWRHYECNPEFRSAVKDSLICGFGWLKTGYRFVEEDEDDPEGYEAGFQKAVTEADEFAMANPDMAGDLPTDEEIAASVPSTRQIIVEDRPFVERVSPFDVYVDPEATTLHNARWIAQRVEKSLEEVKADDSYKSSGRNKVKPDGRLNDEWRGPHQKEKDPDIQRVTVWEYYDLKAGTMCVFPECGDDYLVDVTPQPYEFGHPFVMVRNYEVPDQFYPMGELEALEPLQHELNLTRTAMFNDRKAFRRRWLAQPKAFDKVGRAALQSEDDNVVVWVNGNTPITEAITAMPTSAVNPQLYQDSEVIEGDYENISGVSEYMRGGTQDIRRTATEASIIQDAANSRAADKLAQVEDVIARVARRLVQLAQQYATEEQVVRIAGQNGRPLWVPFTPDDIQGEFDFEVEAGSTQPRNELQRRQEAMNLLQTLAPFADPSGQAGVVNFQELLRYVLQAGFGIKDPGRFLNKAMDPATAGLGMPPEEAVPEEAVDDPMMGGGPRPTPPEGGPPVDPASGGAVPPALAQLAGQVGLSLG